jgi:thymidylate synthase
MFFLRGETNVKYLNDHGIHIWDPWAREDGSLGPVYGAQWGKQLWKVLKEMEVNPHGRRHLVNSWQVNDLGDMVLPPCHYSFQFYIDKEGLSTLVNMRSCDVIVGLPHNVACYALLTYMVAKWLDLRPHRLLFMLGDTHIYINHLEAATRLLKAKYVKYPTLEIKERKPLLDYTIEDFNLIDYNPNPAIKLPVAI